MRDDITEVYIRVDASGLTMRLRLQLAYAVLRGWCAMVLGGRVERLYAAPPPVRADRPRRDSHVREWWEDADDDRRRH